MKPEAWQVEVGKTWLANQEFCAVLDAWVRKSLAGHRNVDRRHQESVAPWSVQVLAADIVSFGAQQRWLWCTTAIGITAELVLCAQAGGIFTAAGVSFRHDLKRAAEALREIRNAAVHPAFQRADAGSGLPPMERVVELLDNDDDGEVKETALHLAEDWGLFGGRPVTSFALRQLNTAVKLYAAELGLAP